MAVNGEIVEGVEPRLKQLVASGIEVFLLTGNQRGNADEICSQLGIDFKIAGTAGEKSEIVSQYDRNTTVSIGNGRIDIGMFKNSVLSIATLQSEGIHTEILSHVDVIVPSIIDALEFILQKSIFEGTMRR